MMNKYQIEMNNIVVTPQMEERLLKNLSALRKSALVEKRKVYPKWMKTGFAVAVCMILAISAIGASYLIGNPLGSERIPKVADNAKKVTSKLNKQQIAKVPTQTDKTAENPCQPRKAEQSENKVKSKKQPIKMDRPSGKSSKSTSPSEEDQTVNGATPPSGGIPNNTPNKVVKEGENAMNSGSEQLQTPSSSPTPTETDIPAGGVTVTSPIVNAKGIEELKKQISFELLIPTKLPTGYQVDSTSVIMGDLAQIIYSDGHDHKITYREAKGEEDISGDYTSYGESDSINLNGMKIILKGDHSLISLATWTQDGYAYSLSFSDGLEKGEVITIIGSLSKA